MFHLGIGGIFGAISLVLGLLADYFQSVQMEKDIQDQVDEAIRARLGDEQDEDE